MFLRRSLVANKRSSIREDRSRSARGRTPLPGVLGSDLHLTPCPSRPSADGHQEPEGFHLGFGPFVTQMTGTSTGQALAASAEVAIDDSPLLQGQVWDLKPEFLNGSRHHGPRLVSCGDYEGGNKLPDRPMRDSHL